ncbi:MAG: tetratricopeptide repeat protein [Anaerolineales bacterium]
MTLDILQHWDFNDPVQTEVRLIDALASASEDEALIIGTQIARTYGIRKDFTHARELLAELEPAINDASDEARAYYYLELGRAYASATHDAKALTSEEKQAARSAYLTAFDIAKGAELDSLAVDALHMMPFVDTDPEEQMNWNQRAIETIEASSQEQAKRWEGSLRNNLGYALHQAGRLEEALAQFRLALAAREREGDSEEIRIAQWMVAWTLRSLGVLQEALDIQLRLEREYDADGVQDPYVFEELELLYQELDDPERARHYAERLKASRGDG